MNFKLRLKICLLVIKDQFNIFRINKDINYKNNFIVGELLRNIHSIEKGLSIANTRLGFGHKKQEEMFEEIDILKSSSDTYHRDTIKMAVSALEEYIEFHEKRQYEDDFIENMKKKVGNIKKELDIEVKKLGGVIEIKREDLKFNVKEIEHFFNTRHSVRDFEDSEVNIESIKKAIKLAQRAPSACNRQGVRAYILSSSNKDALKDWCQGIGGFQNEVKSYIAITSKLSAYRPGEVNQHVVTSSVYAAYLTLTLHLYGLGACFIQRPVIFSEKWENLRKKWNIPKDEQIICLIGVGNLKEKFVVPFSNRLDENEIMKLL